MREVAGIIAIAAIIVAYIYRDVKLKQAALEMDRLDKEYKLQNKKPVDINPNLGDDIMYINEAIVAVNANIGKLVEVISNGRNIE